MNRPIKATADGFPYLILDLQPGTALDDLDERAEVLEAVAFEELVGDVRIRHEVLALDVLVVLDPVIEVLADLDKPKLELVKLVLLNDWGREASVNQSSDAYCMGGVLALLERLEVAYDPVMVWPARILLLNHAPQRL